MAQSPAHRFGQIIGETLLRICRRATLGSARASVRPIIGETLEAAVRPILEAVAAELGLYLDSKGKRAVRDSKRKVVWIDAQGNSHDLDYVLEAGGSAETIGTPRAFIEIAWRRYTKHSRNKAQEIQGAILPLAERYRDCHPFLGVVLGGVFTEGSLTQLRSHGFGVLYFPYESIAAAFAVAAIDATFDEDTPDSTLLRKVKAYEKLKPQQRERIAAHLRDRHAADVNIFVATLRVALTRRIASIYVLPLHGAARTLENLAEAIAFIEAFDELTPRSPFTRYEVGVRYSNGDEIRGQFQDKLTAVTFLRGMQ